MFGKARDLEQPVLNRIENWSTTESFGEVEGRFKRHVGLTPPFASSIKTHSEGAPKRARTSDQLRGT